MKRIFLYLLFFLPLSLRAQKIISLTVDGIINPVAAGYIHRGIEQAASQQATAVLIHLNTPGGLLQSTRQIVSDILQSRVPVIVYVSPAGAHAGSAGVFITLAADLAVMAPGTNIGAAHPVGMQGSPDSIMNGKITNDASAFIRTIADFRKRNADWAETAVRQSVALTSKEALQKNIIDFIASGDEDLLKQADGKMIRKDSVNSIIHTRGATVEVLTMGFMEKVLDLISDPNVAYVLLMLGLFGLVFELFNPGSIFPGIIGFISLVLAFYALNTMPVSYAGLALIVFGVVLLLLEIKITSHGMLAIGGISALAIGSLMLIRPVSTLEFMQVSPLLIASSVVVSTAFFLFIVGIGIRAQRAKPVTGIDGMIGKAGEAIDELNPSGRVRLRGEIWNAVSLSGQIPRGSPVQVREIKNLTIYVETIHPST